MVDFIRSRRGPGINPLNPRSMRQLERSKDWSVKQCRFYLERRLSNLREFVGQSYTEQGSDDRVALPMVNMMVDTFHRKLVPSDPSVACTSEQQADPESIVCADDLQLGINYALRKSNAVRAYSRGAVEAMFGWAMFKVALDVEGGGLPYVENVSPEDSVLDMTARVEEEFTYIGNRYRVPYDWAMTFMGYDRRGRAKLRPNDDNYLLREGDIRPEVFSSGTSFNREYYTKMVDLWDFYLPRENLIVTTAAENFEYPLRVAEWMGPERGPFNLMRFGYVPGNVLPLAPVHLTIDLHILMNRMFNKVSRQALNQKTVLAVDMANLSDGDAIAQADDLQVVPTVNPNGIKEVAMNGANQQTTGMVLYLRDLFSYFCGNLDLIAGSGTQTPTAKQDMLLSQSANEKIVYMQGQMAKLQTEVAEDVGYWLWNDPGLNLPLKKMIADSIEVPFQLTPDRLRGDYYSYNIRVAPYSIANRTPEEKLGVILGLVERIQPILESAGLQYDAERILDVVSRFAQVPEMRSFYKFPSGRQRPEKPEKIAPTSTERTYTHNHVSQGTRGGKERVMAASLMGANQQPKEMAMAAR